MMLDELRAAARRFLAQGYAMLPVNGKRPWDVAAGAERREWNSYTLTEATLEAELGPGITGLGVRLGAPSADVADVDLDSAEALAVAASWLPPTTCIFGRASKRRSHWLYTTTPPPKSLLCTDYPDAPARTPSSTMLVELRSTGLQTIVPPSLHLESGERVCFESDGAPTAVAPDVLVDAVRHLGATALLGRHWPRSSGYRHHLALALAGFLLPRGLPAAVVQQLLELAAQLAGDEEWRDRGQAVASTAEAVGAGRWTTGGGRLHDFLDKRLITHLVKMLGVRPVVEADATARAHARERRSETAAPPPDPDEAQETDAGDTPWAQALPAPLFCAQVDEVADWLVPGVLMPGALTRLNSPRGIGKTNVGHSYAVQLAQVGKRVLLFDRDNPSHVIRTRLRAWGGDVLTPIEVLSREHAPALTEPRAWKDFPVGKYDVVVLDSWDASTEGVGEQDSAKPSLAQKTLLDLAHRANGPAILVLANTTKSGEAGRGAGTIEDREDVVFEVRDATGVTFTGRPEWWLDLPDASRGSWGDRAARRQKRDRLRLAFVYSMFRVGIEPDPFALEIDFTTTPWSVRDVTDDIIAAGQAAAAAASQQAADRVAAAMDKLRQEVEGRAAAGEEPYRKETATKFLMVMGLTQKQAREVVNQGNGTHWRLEQLTTRHGHPVVLVPLNSAPSQREEPDPEAPAAQGLEATLPSSVAPEAGNEKSPNGNPCATTCSEDQSSRCGSEEKTSPVTVTDVLGVFPGAEERPPEPPTKGGTDGPRD
jgi:hypothetical protein